MYVPPSSSPLIFHIIPKSSLSVLRTHEISHRLGLLVVVLSIAVVVVAVCVVRVRVLLWSDVLHLQDVAALRAALDWAVAGHLRLLVLVLEKQKKRGGGSVR